MKTLFTNVVCVTCLAGLAALQFSWVFSPWLASVVAFGNLGFVLALAVVYLIRRFVLRFLPTKSTAAPNPAQPGAGAEPEVDYFAFAKWLIHEHGAGARAEAVRLTQEAMQEQDSLAVTDWRAVEQAIALLANDTVATRH